MDEVKTKMMLLKEIDSLVRAGRLYDARDLLLKAIDAAPDSPLLWEALGRTLIRLEDHDQAIEALKTAYRLRDAESSSFVTQSVSHDNVDLQYIEETDGEFRALDSYEYGEEDSSFDKADNITKPKSHRLTLTKSSLTPSACSRKGKVTYRVKNGKIHEGESTPSQIEPVNTNLSSLDQQPPKEWLKNYSSSVLLRQSIDDQYSCHNKTQTLHTGQCSDHLEDEDEDEDERCFDEEVEPFIDDDEFTDDTLPELDGFFEDILLDDSQNGSADPFDMDEADLFSFDPEDVSEEDETELSFDIPTRLAAEDRAYQVAIEFAHRFDWSITHLDLLATIFNSKGWGTVKKVLTHYAEQGMSADELAVAAQLRFYWSQSKHYWIVFYPSGESDSRYKTLSWAQCLRLVRLYSCVYQYVPEYEEVLELIEELYQDWFSSGTLRRYYRAFSKYLSSWVYRRTNTNQPLNTPNSFGDFELSPDESWSDTGYYDLMGIELTGALEGYGFSHGKDGLLRQADKRESVGEGVMLDKALFKK